MKLISEQWCDNINYLIEQDPKTGKYIETYETKFSDSTERYVGTMSKFLATACSCNVSMLYLSPRSKHILTPSLKPARHA